MKIKVLGWWQKTTFPVRKVWLALSARVKARNNNGGSGLLKLHDDVQTCGYEDVRIMWEMLRRTTTDDNKESSSSSSSSSSHVITRRTKRKQRWFWRSVESSARTTCSTRPFKAQ